MILKWILWCFYVWSFEFFAQSYYSHGADLIEKNFVDVQNETNNDDVFNNDKIRNDGVVRKTVLRKTDDRSRDNNEINLVNSALEESSRFIINPLTDSELGIEINLFISDVKSHSVKISWKADTQMIQRNFGLKVSFRSFGSSIEREVIFLVENSRDMSNELNYYQVNGLTQNTGYVFCFSLIQEKGVIEVLRSADYKQVTTKRSISNDIQKPPLITTNTRESTTSIPITEGTLISVKHTPIITTATKDRARSLFQPITTEDEEDPITFEATTNLQFESTTTAVVTEKTSTSPKQASKKGSYVYTSTGELIFLPTSSWNPFRKKRSADSGSLRVTFQNSFKKVSGNNHIQCTEIFTSKVSIFAAGNFVIVFTIVVIIVCLIILLLMICCINKLLCKISIFKSLKQLTFGIKNARKQGTTEVDITSAVTYVRDASLGNRRESLDESTDVESTIPCCSCKSSSLPSYHEILLRHEIKEQLKESEALKKKNSTDIFHPGYAIPPSSKTDAYGYDIPKLPNKELNFTCNDGLSWKDKEIYNWNCYAQRKKSAYASKNVPRLQDIFSPNPPISSTSSSSQNNQVISEDPKLLTSVNETNNTDVENTQRLYDIISEELLTYPDICASMRENSIGDITITGGTLIEVPEGYVVPDKSRGLSLVVTGTPVYL